MAKRTIVPFGPQHPVLPEPIHLDLVLEDETVVEAIPSIGYIHRGLNVSAESAASDMDGAHAHPWKALWELKSLREQNTSELSFTNWAEFTATCCGWD